MPGILRERGLRVEPHDQHFSEENTPDDVILSKVGQHGWVFVTTDQRFRYNERAKQALRSAKCKAVILTAKDMSGVDKAELFAKFASRVTKRLQDHAPPIIVRVTRTGVSIIESRGRKAAIRRK